jgi:predicted nucleotidyltransferase
MDILKITKSKTREKILRLFFTDADKKYYLRQLERMLDLPVGNIRRELLALEKTGLFKKEEMGKETYYFLNKESAVFLDLKNIVFKTIGVAGSLKKELTEIEGIEYAFIFGSFAKNQEDSSSDVDLMIVGQFDENVLIEKVARLEKLLNREINYHYCRTDEWHAKLRENSFYKSIYEGSKIELVKKGNG